MLWLIIITVAFTILLVELLAEWAERHERIERKIRQHKRLLVALGAAAVLAPGAHVVMELANVGLEQQTHQRDAIEQGLAVGCSLGVASDCPGK